MKQLLISLLAFTTFTSFSIAQEKAFMIDTSFKMKIYSDIIYKFPENINTKFGLDIEEITNINNDNSLILRVDPLTSSFNNGVMFKMLPSGSEDTTFPTNNDLTFLSKIHETNNYYILPNFGRGYELNFVNKLTGKMDSSLGKTNRYLVENAIGDVFPLGLNRILLRSNNSRYKPYQKADVFTLFDTLGNLIDTNFYNHSSFNGPNRTLFYPNKDKILMTSNAGFLYDDESVFGIVRTDIRGNIDPTFIRPINADTSGGIKAWYINESKKILVNTFNNTYNEDPALIRSKSEFFQLNDDGSIDNNYKMSFNSETDPEFYMHTKSGLHLFMPHLSDTFNFDDNVRVSAALFDTLGNLVDGIFNTSYFEWEGDYNGRNKFLRNVIFYDCPTGGYYVVTNASKYLGQPVESIFKVYDEIQRPLLPIVYNPTSGVASNNTKLTFFLSPNPASGMISIQATQDYKGTYTILNILGKQVLSGNMAGSTTINTESLPSGSYIVRLCEKGTGVVGQEKLVISR